MNRDTTLVRVHFLWCLPCVLSMHMLSIYSYSFILTCTYIQLLMFKINIIATDDIEFMSPLLVEQQKQYFPNDND